MDINKGRILFLAGIGMCFENIKYARYIGIIMMILGIMIIFYNKQLIIKNKDKIINEIIQNYNNKIIKFFEDNKYILIKKKEISIIKIFEKKYNINNIINNIININNINIIINDNQYNYDNITLFLEIYRFIINLKNIIEMDLINDNLIIRYYEYYNNIIVYISNLDNKIEISTALSYLIDDINNNIKHLDILFNCSEKNINSINKKLDNIINDNTIEKFDRFMELHK